MNEYEKVMKVLFDRGLPSETCGIVANLFNKNKDLESKLAEYMEIVKAVAHIGIDWGYGKFELNQDHIDKARKLYDTHEQLKEKGDENV